MLSIYVPLVSLGVLALGFAVFSAILASIVGPKRYNRAKYEPYECGIEPAIQEGTAGRFSIKFYLTAMMFIVFDVVLIFLYPFAVNMGALGWFGFVEVVIFVATVFIAYIYVWRRGGLDWN